MAWYTFGGSVNDYVEIPDPDYIDEFGTTKMKRPVVGTTVLVRDVETQLPPVSLASSTGASISAVTTMPYGYLAFSADLGVPLIQVSGDNGVSWKFLVAMEALTGSASAVIAANAAAVAAVAAQNAATTAADRQKLYSPYEVWASGAVYDGPYPTPLPTGYARFIFWGTRDPGVLSSPGDEWNEPST